MPSYIFKVITSEILSSMYQNYKFIIALFSIVIKVPYNFWNLQIFKLEVF